MITAGSISLTIAIPGKSLAGRYQCISSESTVDSEFQPHRILATLCICKYEIMITTGRISLTVTIPCESLTCGHQRVGSESTIDREFQSHRILATLCIGKCVIMITGGIIGLAIAIPGKRLTGCYQCISSESTVDSKFQPHRILATLRIGKYVVMITTGSISLTVTIPCESLTCGHQRVGSESTIDREFQSHRILETFRICKYVVMITTGSISLTITIPCKGLTGCYQCIGS